MPAMHTVILGSGASGPKHLKSALKSADALIVCNAAAQLAIDRQVLDRVSFHAVFEAQAMSIYKTILEQTLGYGIPLLTDHRWQRHARNLFPAAHIQLVEITHTNFRRWRRGVHPAAILTGTHAIFTAVMGLTTLPKANRVTCVGFDGSAHHDAHQDAWLQRLVDSFPEVKFRFPGRDRGKPPHPRVPKI